MHYLRVLVVTQDSKLLDMLCGRIATDAAMRLVGSSVSAGEAVRMASETRPDVIALDMSLAEANGLQIISELHRACPASVVAISAVTGNAIETLDAGAADFIPMPVKGSDTDLRQFIADTIEKLKIALLGKQVCQRDTRRTGEPIKLVAIVAATGGLMQIACLLRGLPMDCPPVLALQQNPEAFSGSYAAVLAGMTGRDIILAEDGMALKPGCVVIADTRFRTEIAENGDKLVLKLFEKDNGAGCEDTGNLMFLSAAQTLGEKAAGVSFFGNELSGLKHLAACGALAILHNKNALLRDVGYTPNGGLLEMPLEDVAGEILKRI